MRASAPAAGLYNTHQGIDKLNTQPWPIRSEIACHAVALSGDGNTLAVGANYEESNATGVDGHQSDNSSSRSGAAYLY